MFLSFRFRPHPPQKDKGESKSSLGDRSRTSERSWEEPADARILALRFSRSSGFRTGPLVAKKMHKKEGHSKSFWISAIWQMPQPARRVCMHGKERVLGCKKEAQMFWSLSSNSRELELSNFFRARSRLYRSQNLRVNTRWKALAEIYTMPSFAQL